MVHTPEANLVAGMKWFQGTYTQRFNSMFKRRGHLFQGRYKALPIDPEKSDTYFRAVGQYIHLNPYRAKLAGIGQEKLLEEFKWSSYPVYIGAVKKRPEWLYCKRLYEAFDLVGSRGVCQSKYKSLAESRMLGEADHLADATEALVEKQIKRGWYIGGELFKGQLTEMITGHSDNLRGDQRRAHDEKGAEQFISELLGLFELSDAAICAMKSTRLEKQAVAWFLKKKYNRDRRLDCVSVGDGASDQCIEIDLEF